jgi:thiol-disulfide isomerase/thioredoxin
MSGAQVRKRPEGSRLWYRAGQLLLILGVVAAVSWWRSAPLAHGDAPALNGQLLLTGESFDLAGLRGQPALVHFWATWCPVCGLGNGTIDAIAEDYPVITVAMQSGSPADIVGYMTNEGLSFPVIPDPHGELASRWGVRGVPTSFVVDGHGRIRFATVGYTTGIGLRGRLWTARHLD